MMELYYWTTPNGHKITMFMEESGLDYVKLDASMVSGVGSDEQRAVFVRSTVTLLHGMSIQVYAEGVADAADPTPLDAATGYPLDWDPLRRSHIDMDELKLKSSEDAIKKLFASGKRVLVVTGTAHRAAVCRQLPEVEDGDLVLESEPKDSGAAIGRHVADWLTSL